MLANSHVASPALNAVTAPPPNRGRIAAYTHIRTTPAAKSKSSDNGTSRSRCVSVIAGLPTAFQATAIGAFRTAPYIATSIAQSTAPAINPPTRTLRMLIFCILAPGGWGLRSSGSAAVQSHYCVGSLLDSNCQTWHSELGSKLEQMASF